MKKYWIDKGVYERERTKKHLTAEEVKSKNPTLYKCLAPEGGKRDSVEGIAKTLGIDPWWKLLIEDQQEAFREGDIGNTWPIIREHRVEPESSERFLAAFGSGGHVVHLGVMAKDSLSKIDAAITQDTTVDVLTWMPKSEAEMRAYDEYLHEAGDKIAQLKGALEGWDAIAKKHPNVHVYTYSCTPVLHGVSVENEWVEIEILPYDTRPDMRPAVFFKKGEARSMYAFFWHRLHWFLKASNKRNSGELPEWLKKKAKTL